MILDYKNRFKLVFDIIFRRNKVKEIIRDIKIKQENKIKYDFEDRLRLIEFDQYKNGIVRPNSNPVLVIPIIGQERTSYYQGHQVETKKIKKLTVSYFNLNNLNSKRLKVEAARNIANQLVEEGFLQARIDGNYVEFYINKF